MALVIRCRLHDKVMIGDQMVLEVVEIRSGRIKLGLTAPPELKIQKLEDWQRERAGGAA